MTPGARGWKALQRELVRAHLDAPRAELNGQSFAAAVFSERIGAWAGAYSSPARRQAADAVVSRLLRPPALPEHAADVPLPRWQWLRVGIASF